MELVNVSGNTKRNSRILKEGGGEVKFLLN